LFAVEDGERSKCCDLFGIGILDDAQRPDTQQLAGNLLGAEKNTQMCI
jgi:hypothetical protein